jgi:Cys-tRNA(Pro)/Cys-tRNA(Cys) deacylase
LPPKTTARGATPATRLLDRAGIEYGLHAYDFAPGDDGIGLQAALALGVAPARVLKTLVVELDAKSLALALLAVDRTLDLKATAEALGGKRARLASVPAAERATGYVKGGISPFATRRPLPTALDAAARDHERVLVNGGRRGLQIELASADLAQLLEARVGPIARG